MVNMCCDIHLLNLTRRNAPSISLMIWTHGAMTGMGQAPAVARRTWYAESRMASDILKTETPALGRLLKKIRKYIPYSMAIGLVLRWQPSDVG